LGGLFPATTDWANNTLAVEVAVILWWFASIESAELGDLVGRGTSASKRPVIPVGNQQGSNQQNGLEAHVYYQVHDPTIPSVGLLAVA
jgi:hypothetical protein